MPRIDTASLVVRASPPAVYHAFVDPNAFIAWLPPTGMSGRIDQFDATPGGAYRLILTYLELDPSSPHGKSTENTDIVSGRFLELVPNERIVQLAEFHSDDPAFGGEMIMTWTFAPVAEGTLVTVACENVPEGIRKEDHDEGLRASLANLAAYTECSSTTP